MWFDEQSNNRRIFGECVLRNQAARNIGNFVWKLAFEVLPNGSWEDQKVVADRYKDEDICINL